MQDYSLINLPPEEIASLKDQGLVVYEEIPGSPFRSKKSAKRGITAYMESKAYPNDSLSFVTRQIENEREEDMYGKGKYDTVFNFQLNTQNGVPELKPAMLTVEDFAIRGAAETKRIEEKYLKGAAIGYSDQLNGVTVTYRCSWINVKAQPYNESLTIARFDINQTEYGRVVVLASGNDDMLSIRHRAELVLTGQFVDNLDGRWHLVKLNGSYRLATKRLANQYKGVQFNDAEDHSFIFKYGFVREDCIGGLEVRPEIKTQKLLIPYFEYDIGIGNNKTIYADPMPIEYTEEPAYMVGGTFESLLRRVYRNKENPQYFRYDYVYRYNGQNGMCYFYMLTRRWRVYERRNRESPLYPLSVPRVQPFYNHGNPNYIDTLVSDLNAEAETERKSNNTVLAALAAGLLAWWKFR